MKTGLTLMFSAGLALGCATSVTDETDPYETADYEAGVFAAVPKGDSTASGATAALGLPGSASCPETVTPAADNDTGDETDNDTAMDNETADNETVAEELRDPCAEALETTPWAQVYDIELAHVVLPDELAAPGSYPSPRTDLFRMGGTEFWQKWPGGSNPQFGYGNGTELGKRCMAAAALRFQLILSHPSENMQALRERSNWSGSFFNWNDDFSGEGSWSDATGGRLWAWRTGLIKFISQTAQDGSCYLPTLSMMESLAVNCLSRAESSDGEIQGCRSN